MGAAAWGVLSLSDSLWHLPEPREEACELKTSGAYALVRHPMYFGVLCGCAGVTVITGSLSRVLLTAALAKVFDEKSALEEAWLEERHGEQWARFCEATPHKILPGVW